MKKPIHVVTTMRPLFVQHGLPLDVRCPICEQSSSLVFYLNPCTHTKRSGIPACPIVELS
jgi:hypothetical protein